jgi:hypothetical protein
MADRVVLGPETVGWRLARGLLLARLDRPLVDARWYANDAEGHDALCKLLAHAPVSADSITPLSDLLRDGWVVEEGTVTPPVGGHRPLTGRLTIHIDADAVRHTALWANANTINVDEVTELRSHYYTFRFARAHVDPYPHSGALCARIGLADTAARPEWVVPTEWVARGLTRTALSLPVVTANGADELADLVAMLEDEEIRPHVLELRLDMAECDRVRAPLMHLAEQNSHAVRLVPFSPPRAGQDPSSDVMMGLMRELSGVIGDMLCLWEPWGTILETALARDRYGLFGTVAPCAMTLSADGVVRRTVSYRELERGTLPCTGCAAAPLCIQHRVPAVYEQSQALAQWLCKSRQFLIEELLNMIASQSEKRVGASRNMAFWHGEGSALVFES